MKPMFSSFAYYFSWLHRFMFENQLGVIGQFKKKEACRINFTLPEKKGFTMNLEVRFQFSTFIPYQTRNQLTE
jgi:hypothetical protein